MRSSRPLTWPALCLTTFGCTASDPGGWTGTVDTLPSGIVHTANPDRGLWGEAPQWSLDEVATIGTALDSGPHVFGNVTDIDVDAVGRVYVFDHQAQDVRVFDRDGSYVRTIGRPGRGPGEFRAVGIGIDLEQRLWVYNQGNLRYSVFDTSGALRSESRRTIGRVRFAQWTHTFTPDGSVYEIFGYRNASGTHFGLGRYDTAVAALVDTLPLPQFPEGIKLFSGTRRLVADGWWLGIKDRYRLAKVTLAGDTTRIVDLARDPHALSTLEQDSAEQFERDMTQRVTRGEVDIETEWQPVFQQVLEDDQGHLWVVLPHDSVFGTGLDVFDSDGRYLGQLSLPNPVDPFVEPVVKRNRFYYLTKDSLDVPYVMIAEIRGRS